MKTLKVLTPEAKAPGAAVDSPLGTLLHDCMRIVVEAEEQAAPATHHHSHYGGSAAAAATPARKDLCSLLLWFGSEALVLRFVKCLKVPELVSLTGTDMVAD